MDAQLKDTLEELRTEIRGFRDETARSLRAVRLQLNTLEYGVLTIAQKLLAEVEVDELKTRMADHRRVAVG
jgi:hypothetical protein